MIRKMETIFERRSMVKVGLIGLAGAFAGKTAMASVSAAGSASATGAHRLTLEERVERQEAIQEVIRVTSNYELYLDAGYLQQAADCFAMKQSDVRADIGFGGYVGPENIKRLYLKVHKFLQGDQADRKTLVPGALFVLCNTTPSIVVAGDGKTAKGLWITPGFSTVPMKDGPPQAFWDYTKRGYDYIREDDGKWKIWHYRVYGLFQASFTKSWAENKGEAVGMADALPPDMRPDHPGGEHWMYGQTAVLPVMPKPPEPYETFSETFSYI